MATSGGYRPPGRRVVAAAAVTDAGGLATITFDPPFPAPPVVASSTQTLVSDITECRITNLTASSVTFEVRRSPAVSLLGISLLEVPQPAPGVTVHCVATEPEQP